MVAAKQETELKGRRTVSRVFPDGTLVDMVYVKDSYEPRFAVARGEGVNLVDEPLVDEDGNYTDDPKNAVLKLTPHWTVRDLVDKNFIHLASKPEEYGSTKELYEQIRSLIKTYVVLEDSRFYDVATSYILMTWVFDRFSTLPYLRVVGDLGTGKSRFLEVVGKLCNRAMLASGSISMAAVFRTLDIVQGTLVFDEADFKSSDMSDEIVKLLNGGHKKDTPVIRMEMVNDILKPMPFRVFGPKILGSRRNFGDTALESRCITQRLFPLKSVDAPVHLPPTLDADTQVFRNKLLMFRLKNFHQVHDDVSSLEGLEFPRLRQTALALTSIVKLVGTEELNSVMGFLIDYQTALLDTVSTGSLADVLLCIARLIENDQEVRRTGHLYMYSIALAFKDTFYDDYAERETREVNTREGLFVIPGQRVSPRKIGVYVDKLGIAKARDGKGVYIPLAQEGNKINSLIERYRLAPVLKQEREDEEERKHNPKKVPGSEFVEDDPHPF